VSPSPSIAVPSAAVAAFLSPEWIAELDHALRELSISDTAAAEPLVIEQIVTETPTGDVHFHVVLDARSGCARVGPAADAQLRITTDFTTAVALLRGETNAQHALASGRMRIRGDLEVLARRANELSAVSDLFGAVRAATTIP